MPLCLSLRFVMVIFTLPEVFKVAYILPIPTPEFCNRVKVLLSSRTRLYPRCSLAASVLRKPFSYGFQPAAHRNAAGITPLILHYGQC